VMRTFLTEYVARKKGAEFDPRGGPFNIPRSRWEGNLAGLI